MTIEEVLKFYGSTYKFHQLTGMSHTNFVQWKKLGYIPITTQIKIEGLSKSKLKADLSHCPRAEEDVNVR